MAFLLKIVEGPNKGAEIALVEGVAITLGKTDDCDVILADPTLPDAPLEISASADAVLVGGVPLEPFNVRTAGSTGIAVGPADAPWGPLVWPKPEETSDSHIDESSDRQTVETKDDGTIQQSDDGTTGQSDNQTIRQSDNQTKKRRGCLGCLLAAIVILTILLLLGWIFRAALRPRAQALRDRISVKWRSNGGGEVSAVNTDAPASSGFALEKLADHYGLLLEEDNGRAKLSGNFTTRAERLQATAEAYASRPGIDLDFSDDESFRTAAEDSLFTLTEGAMKVMTATNRYLHLTGISESPLTLQKTLEQLNSDLPKLRGFDVASVKLVSPASPMPSEAAALADKQSNRQTVKRPARPVAPVLPVCGILTTPYPCLVMRDGRRILEGGTVGDATILSIDADSVTVTNAAGRFTWKP